MKSLKILSFFLIFGLISAPLFSQERPPVIDMHMHTGMPHHVPEGTPALCRPEPCRGKGGATSPADLLQKTLDIMDRYNIVKGFLSGVDLQTVDQWKKTAPDRFIASPFIFNPGTPDSLQLNEDIVAGRFGGIGEIGAQLNGAVTSRFSFFCPTT